MTRRAVLTLSLFAIAGLRCTALTVFDPEGQPCEMNVARELSCLADAGYVCVDGICTKNGSATQDAGRADAGRTDAGFSDAGADGGRDAGASDAGTAGNDAGFDGGSDGGNADAGDGG